MKRILKWLFIANVASFIIAALLIAFLTKEARTDVIPTKASINTQDPAASQNWGLFGTGGSADIRAKEAWKISTGNKRVVVAVVDTGADINHPDLFDNIWINVGETGIDSNGKDKSMNNIDDDNNGFIDDANGYNFVGNNADLSDNHGHGTHVAGVIGAVGNNGLGSSGVAQSVSLMILKYYDPKSYRNDNLKNTIKAIRYAIKMKADIINYSGGGIEYSAEEFAVIKEAMQNGILFVAAAGNEKSNSDEVHYYPADYALSNIISVTAINSRAELLSSSNWGVKTVHIAAPGEGIFSTLPGNRYGLMTGTSQATAFTTGVAALLMSSNEQLNVYDVKRRILQSSDELVGLRSKTKISGKLNAYAALAMKDANESWRGDITRTVPYIVDTSPLPKSTASIFRGIALGAIKYVKTEELPYITPLERRRLNRDVDRELETYKAGK